MTAIPRHLPLLMLLLAPASFAASPPAATGPAAAMGRQSVSLQHNVLAPAGPQAQILADMSWLMFAGGAAIFLAVMALTVYALFGPRNRTVLGRLGLIVAGGIAFPVVTLTALMIYGFGGSANLLQRGEPMLHIEVIGEQYWWRIRYLDASGTPRFETANEIHLPTGEPVQLHLRSADVIHSLWVPSLHGKLDLIPGRVNIMHMQANERGVFRGQCAEYCGAQHAKMGLLIIAQSPEEFAAWQANQAKEATTPTDGMLAVGSDLFLESCASCHTIRGTPADGVLGPDLTHVASRRTLAAALLPNNLGALQGWIADSQTLKPGNRMPAFNSLPAEDLHALGHYVESLR